VLIAYAAGGKEPPGLGTPRPKAAPLGTPSRYRYSSPTRRAAGATQPPAPPAQGCAPGNPNLILLYAERLARMPVGRADRQLMI